MKKKYYIAIIALLVILIIMNAGMLNKGNGSPNFDENIVQLMTQYNEEYEGIELTAPMEIVVHEIYYGSFSAKDADEMLVVCKVLNAPHVAGLDKTLCAVLEAETLELVAYEQFEADKVVTACVKNSEGQSRILVSAVAGSQGFYSQMLSLFSVEDKQWVSIPQENLDYFGEEAYYFVGENCLIVSSSASELKTEEIVAVLHWDAYAEQFVAENTSGN
ncbi:MAG: hypothetical protein IJZ82_02165 [Lachnospiraceae bacterium]|nr:hypothetical protein [Lachnospiraceae bacterium]